jgi:2-iminobutanoate/2-iminopropanoate deaminase
VTSRAGSQPASPKRQALIVPVRTQDAPIPRAPYSQAIAAGGLLFVSGQRPELPGSAQIPSGIEGQTHQVLRNLAAVLNAGGSQMSHVLKVTAYLADLRLFDQFNAVYLRHFTAPYPARTTVACGLRDILVEIDAIALSPQAAADPDPEGARRGVQPG